MSYCIKNVFMFLQARVVKDEQHQWQDDLEQMDNNRLLSVNHEY